MDCGVEQVGIATDRHDRFAIVPCWAAEYRIVAAPYRHTSVSVPATEIRRKVTTTLFEVGIATTDSVLPR